MELKNNIISKIVTNDAYVIFYVPECPYSMKALNLLREKKVKYKGYNIHNLGGMKFLLETFNENKEQINFNPDHLTKPVIFYNGKYLGGYSDLKI